MPFSTNNIQPDFGTPLSYLYVGATQANTGFLSWPLHSDAIVYYVSSSLGSDGNDGLSEGAPFATKSKASGLVRNNSADRILFKTGDTFQVEDDAFGNMGMGRPGLSSDFPIVMSFYGDIALGRPKFFNFSINISNATPSAYVVTDGLDFYSEYHDPFSPNYNESFNISFTLKGEKPGLIYQDCVFEWSEWNIQGDNDVQALKNLMFKRCIHKGASVDDSSYFRSNRSTSWFMAYVDGLIVDECTTDLGGWHPSIATRGANQLSHIFYIQYTCNGREISFTNNILSRGASHGAHLRNGGYVAGNFTWRCSIGLQVGYNGQPLELGDFATCYDNVITECRSMVKGDEACYFSTGQDTNVCTSAVWGLWSEEYGDGAFTFGGNIVGPRADNTLDDQWFVDGQVGQLKPAYADLNYKDYDFWIAAILPYENHSYHHNTATQGDNENYQDPGRTLGMYWDLLVANGDVAAATGTYAPAVRTGTDSGETAMFFMLDRNLRQWDDKFSTYGINAYIAEGYQRNE